MTAILAFGKWAVSDGRTCAILAFGKWAAPTWPSAGVFSRSA